MDIFSKIGCFTQETDKIRQSYNQNIEIQVVKEATTKYVKLTNIVDNTTLILSVNDLVKAIQKLSKISDLDETK